MPFDMNKQARVTSEPGNPSKQSVECLAHFFLEQLRQDKISNEQFIVLDRARFERLKEVNGFQENNPLLAGERLYDDRPDNVVLRKGQLYRKINQERENLDTIGKEFEEIMADFEYLVKKESSGSGKSDEKFLRVVNKLGFNLEVYATFRKRALVNWTEKERERARQAKLYSRVDPEEGTPTELELQAEIKRLEAAHKHELDEPAAELLPYMQPKLLNKSALKLYFEDSGNVSFEFPVANPVGADAAARPGPRLGLGLGMVEEDEDHVQLHNARIRRKEAEKARQRSSLKHVPGAAAASAGLSKKPVDFDPKRYVMPSSSAGAAAAAADSSAHVDRKHAKDADESRLASAFDSELDEDRDYSDDRGFDDRDCKDEKDVAERETLGASAGKAARTKHKRSRDYAGASSSLDAGADKSGTAAPTAGKAQKNYMDNGNLFGTYYNTPRVLQPGEDTQTPKPTFWESLTQILGVFGAFLAKIIDVFMGKSEEYAEKSNNAHRVLDTKEPNADLFEDYTKKLADEDVRHKLVDDWNAAKTPEERDSVMESLKDKLASALGVDMSEDLQTLNFKLCLRKLEGVEFETRETAASGSAGALAAKTIKLSSDEKSELSRLWRTGLRKQALDRLHGFMAKAGLYIEMDESLKALEYSTKDKGLLATKEMLEVRETYGKILNEIHYINLKEASEIDREFPAQCYQVRQNMLDAIDTVDKGFNKFIAEDAGVQKLLAECKAAEDNYAQHNTRFEELEALSKSGKIGKEHEEGFKVAYQQAKAQKEQAAQARNDALTKVESAKQKIRGEFAKTLNANLNKIKKDRIDPDNRKVQVEAAAGSAGAASRNSANRRLDPAGMLEKMRAELAKAAAPRQFAERLGAAERNFNPKKAVSAAGMGAAAAASPGRAAASGAAAGSLGASASGGRSAGALDNLRRDDVGGSGLASSTGSRPSL